LADERSEFKIKMRWRLKLEEFDEIVYKSRKTNINADVLLRSSVNAIDSYVTNEDIQHMISDLIKTKLIKIVFIKSN